jgi:hypothetical protein
VVSRFQTPELNPCNDSFSPVFDDRIELTLQAFNPEPIAARYCALKEIPPVSEELRKYIVQANMFNQQKQYYKAIALYNKAME